jgi:hypothetical protein
MEDACSATRRLFGLLALIALVALLGTGSAEAGSKKLVEGTVYDTTCATTCAPECPPPPHCGPITAQSSSAIVCPLRERRIIACPLSKADSVIVCVRAEGCPTSGYPVYSGEGAVVNVRRRGSSTVLATLPIVEGHFKIRLGAGEYMMRPFLPEPQCWSGDVMAVWVTLKLKGPVPAKLYVSDSCVAHPDAATP